MRTQSQRNPSFSHRSISRARSIIDRISGTLRAASARQRADGAALSPWTSTEFRQSWCETRRRATKRKKLRHDGVGRSSAGRLRSKWRQSGCASVSKKRTSNVRDLVSGRFAVGEWHVVLPRLVRASACLRFSERASAFGQRNQGEFAAITRWAQTSRMSISGARCFSFRISSASRRASKWKLRASSQRAPCCPESA